MEIGNDFHNTLNKDQLIKLIRESLLEQKNNQIHLTSIDNKEKKITIIFDKKNFDLIGWEINDQFENKIVFLIEILSTNEDVNLEIFKIPA